MLSIWPLNWENTTRKKNEEKCVVLIISGHSGDEQGNYMDYLWNYYADKAKRSKGETRKKVLIHFSERYILPERKRTRYQVLIVLEIYRALLLDTVDLELTSVMLKDLEITY